jgi:hypothetical protein
MTHAIHHVLLREVSALALTTAECPIHLVNAIVDTSLLEGNQIRHDDVCCRKQTGTSDTLDNYIEINSNFPGSLSLQITYPGPQ